MLHKLKAHFSSMNHMEFLKPSVKSFHFYFINDTFLTPEFKISLIYPFDDNDHVEFPPSEFVM